MISSSNISFIIEKKFCGREELCEEWVHFKEAGLNSQKFYLFLRFLHKSELSPPPCGPRTEPGKTQQSLWIWPLLLCCTFLSVFPYKLESSESSLKVVLSKAGAANRPTEEVEKDRHSRLWNLSPSLSELCMSPENKALYSLQSWWRWRWLPDLVL